MANSLIVSERGQITLPAALRKRLGIRAGGILIVEDRNGELVLRPAAVLPLETYTDQQVAEWDEADRLTPEQRKRVIGRKSKKA